MLWGVARMARLLHRLRQREFTVTVEVDPPRGPDVYGALANIRLFADRVDAINVADCPMANVRMGPIALAHLLQRELQVECIFHLTCRDRNLIGLQAELLGAAGLGVRNLLCLRGDDPSRGNQPDAAPVFQVDAVGLVRIAAALNQGRTIAGVELEAPTDFAIGVAANPGAPDLEREVARLQEKVAAGAHFAQTQPVWSVDQVERFQAALHRAGLGDFPVLYGLMPPLSHKNALYLQKNVPGLGVPDWVVDRMARGGPDEGIRLVAELAAELAPHVHGVHLYPMNRARVVNGILDYLEERGVRRTHPALGTWRSARQAAQVQG